LGQTCSCSTTSTGPSPTTSQEPSSSTNLYNDSEGIRDNSPHVSDVLRPIPRERVYSPSRRDATMGATRSAAEALQSAVATPIAQLSPDLQDAESRAVDGVVTITWPYSFVTKSIAFIIAEQDPLRRRDKGQLRVECHGPAGKALADSGIGGGDAILLSLVGAEWDVAHAKTSLPAGSHDWQLNFTKRILLRARKTESQETVEIDIDAPDAVESEPQPNDGPPRETTPPPPEPQPHDLVATPIPRPATVPAKRLASSMLGPDEFTSPAFLKRARVSYGSLFEDGFDVFAEDKANKSKAKRKSRFSMGHTAWKYSSRSPSPDPGSESEEPATHPDGRSTDEQEQAQRALETSPAAPPRPSMVDEGCQTQDLYFSPSMHVQVSAEPRNAHGAATLAYPAARHDGVHSAPYTPSRTLFGRGPSHGHDISQVMPEPLMDFHGSDPHHHDYGLDTGVPHHGTLADGLFGEHSTGHHVPSTSGFGGSVSAPSYPVPSYGVDSYAPMHGIDPNLHVHDTSQDHAQHDAVQQDDMTWQNNSVGTHFPSQLISDATHYGVVATLDSSPPVAQEPFRGEHGSSAGDSIPDRQLSVSQDQNKSREQSIPGAATSDRASRDGAAPEYQDGGDLPGEDYDLRNYDRAKDDDESVSESEEASESDQDDPDKAAIDFSEEDEEDEEEEEAEEDEEEEEEIPDQHPSAAERASWGHGRQPVATTVSGDEADEDLDEESDSDAGQEHNAGGEYEGEYEGEYYDDEEDDEDEAESYYDEEEEAPPPRAPAAPAEPVFISLLSDSEDEDEAPPRIPAPSVPPGPPPTKQDERATKESSMPLAGDSGRGASTEEERSFNAQPSSEHEYVSDKDAGEDDDNADEGDEDVDEAVESIDEDDESVDEADNDFATQPSGRVSSVDDRRDAGFFKDAHLKESQQTLVGSQLDGAHEDVPLAVAMGGTFSAIVDSKAESQPEPQPADVMEVDDVAEVAEEIQPVAALELDHTQTSGGRRVSEDIEAIQANPMDDKEPADATATESGYVATVPRHEDMRDAPQGEPTEAQTERVTQETAVDAAAEEAGEPLAPSHKDGAQALASEVPANEVTTTEKASEQLPSPSVVQQAEAQHAEVQHAEAQHADEPKPKPELENQPHDEDDVTAEAQIMNEYYSSQSSSRVDYDKVGTHGGSQIHDDEPLITVRSLRSHSHRKTLSADTTSEVHDDPSLRLATARSGRSQSPAEEALTQLSTTEAHLSREEAEQSGREVEAETVPQGKKQKETKTLAARRAARNKGEQPMTQGTVDALAPGEDKKLPSHLTLRASRSKSARSDPSLQLSKALADDNARHAEADRSPATRSARGVGEQTEPDVQPAKASPSSIRSARRHDTPETTRELRSRSHGEGRGVTPETVSQAAIQSPSVAESVVTETEDVSALKKELSKMLRTGLPDALPLRSLRTSLNKTVDIMAVSTTAPPQPHRPKHGPRDYMLELIVTDPSTAPTSVSVAHVFRPHLEYLPVVHAGDVVLLRRMQVVSVKGRGFGVRVGDASAWAVFEKGDEELLPQIKGPPVEVTDGEVEYAKGLRRWWATLDEKTQAKISRATQKASQP